MQKYYDVVIAGGGMIGSVLACKLARNPVLRDLSILLIESAPKKSWKDDLVKNTNAFSNRVSTLNNNTKSLLQQIDVWDTVCSVSSRPVKDIKVWGVGSNRISTSFKADEVRGSEALAYVVENQVMVAAAMMQLDGSKERVHVIHDSSVAEYVLPEDSDKRNDPVVVRLKNGPAIECNILLGCDGVKSVVRQAMREQYLTWKYNQKAIVATLKVTEEKGNYTAWQKFLSTGPLALLPLSDDYSSLVWTTTPEHAKALLSLSNECFVDALNTVLWQEPVDDQLVSTISNAVESFLDAVKVDTKKEDVIPPTVSGVVDGSRASFPVAFGHAVRYVAPQVALLGDAAHRVHPLAGLGVNLGFGDIECLDRVLTKGALCGARLDDFHYLRQYETERQRSNIPKLIGIDLIQKVAGHPWSPLLALTNTAFQVTNAIPPLKKFFVNLAST